jgi:hypothetical protein
LYIDPIKPERVLTDDAVEPLVATPPEVFGGTGSPPVAHRRQEAQHELLEE